ncbi:MAG: 30S ribosomal protein S9 [Candidatus Moranbacteria bacterium]|nr:30S ribosomal protein S9 [Candidatus Moranbacteria bacterium]
MAKISGSRQPDSQEETLFKGKYYYGTGRRKNAVAQVRVYPEGKEAKFSVNRKDYKDYFKTVELKRIAEESLKSAGRNGKLGISAIVRGGGIKGQAEALRLGVARALVALDIDLKPQLRDRGFLTRDPRIKERKKPGLKKARRAPQWQKR